MRWCLSHRADPASREIADRHYNRQSIGAIQFVPPGRCLVLRAETATGKALWITSWPFAKYTKHAYAGAWICTAFRNEGAGVASELIGEAIAATRHWFGDPPELGMVTFLNRKHVKPIKVRGEVTYGRTWRLAGFESVPETKGGLLAFQCPPNRMPEAKPFAGYQMPLFD